MVYQACANAVCDVDDLTMTGSISEGYNAPAFSVFTGTASVTTPVLMNTTDPVKAREISGAVLASTTSTPYTFQIPLM